MGKMYNIAFFLGELQLDTQRKTFEGIMEGAKRDGNNVIAYTLSLSEEDSYNDGEVAMILNDDLSDYDAFIIYMGSLYSPRVRDAIVKKILSYNKVCASIDYFVPGMINISLDTDENMHKLVNHIINYHHACTINYVGGPTHSVNAQIRKSIFEAEMKAAGLTIDENRMFTGDYYASSGSEAVECFEKRGLAKADAYICANDQMALGAYYALTKKGYKIPEDIMLTGYDNIFEAANHYPRITTVNRFEEKTGLYAYENLIRALNNEEYDANPKNSSHVVFAESCGCDAVRPIPHRIVVNRNVERQIREQKYAEIIDKMSAKLTSVHSFNELCEALKEYIPFLGGDKFAASFVDSCSQNITSRTCIIYQNEEFEIISGNLEMEKNKIFSNMGEGNEYIVCPLHFGDKYFGHILIRNSEMPHHSHFYRLFAINLSNSIEHINNYIRMQAMIKHLDEMWVFDPLTHIYNRAGFFKNAEEIFETAKQSKEDMFFLFLDIDGLKDVNDTYGHEEGDRMICDMADVLRKTRKKDQIIMRYGGDEFVLFGTMEKGEETEKVIPDIRNYMKEINDLGDRVYKLDASVGYHPVGFDTDKSLDELICLADQEMYVEKRNKKRHCN